MNKESQSKKAYDFILSQLKSGNWKPGEKIYTEMELCSQLDLSRVAVREAIERCVALGLLTRRKGDGTYVMDFGIGTVLDAITPLLTLKPLDLMDVLVFRYYFEAGNIQEFVRNCDQEHLDALEETYERMKANLRNPSVFYQADYDFHDIIAKGTKNPLTIEISEMLREVLLNAQQTINYTIGTSVGIEYHERIINALREKDERLAVIMMERHIESTMEHVQTNLVTDEKGKKTEQTAVQ